MTKDIIIIGGGPAGLSSAIYAARAGYSVIVFEGLTCGGQAATTPEIENYPAINKISGIEFSQKLYNHAVQLGAQVVQESVSSVRLSTRIKSVYTPHGEYQSKTVIIANGAKRRLLGVSGEQRLAGAGVSYCATCDGAFFKGKATAVVGGGNTALEDALFLSRLCTEVHLIHRRSSFRGDKRLSDAVIATSNIKLHFSTTVSAISGNLQVTDIDVTNLNTGASSKISVSGVFIAIGLEPHNEIFADEIQLDKQGYIISDESCKTNIAGVFVAGDTRAKKVRQLVTAANDGAIAAISAGEYISSTL